MVLNWFMSPQKYLRILTACTGKCDLVWKQGLCRYDQVKMGSQWRRLGPDLNTVVLRRRGIDTGRCHLGLEWGTCRPKVRATTRSYAEAGRILPRAFRRSTALPMPWCWNSGLQKCETRNFCCFKPLGWQYFAMAAPGNWHTHRLYWILNVLSSFVSSINFIHFTKFRVSSHGILWVDQNGSIPGRLEPTGVSLMLPHWQWEIRSTHWLLVLRARLQPLFFTKENKACLVC